MGGWFSHRPTSPLAYTTPVSSPARHGTTWRRRRAVSTLAQCSKGSTLPPNRPRSRAAQTSRTCAASSQYLVEHRPLQRRVLAIPADEREVVVVHPGTALIQMLREAPDLVQILSGGRRNGVNTEAGIGCLQLRKGIVGFHRLLERLLVAAKRVVVLGRAIQRQLADEEPELRPFEHRPDGRDCPLGEVAVGRHVYLPRAVLFDELAAHGGEFLAEERLAARQVQVLYRSEVLRERDDLVEREVVPLVEVLPVKAVLAGQVADGVDEQDQERRRLRRLRADGLQGQTNVASDAGRRCWAQFTWVPARERRTAPRDAHRFRQRIRSPDACRGPRERWR